MPPAEENVTSAPGTAKGPAPGTPGGARGAEHQYEFKASENKVIGELASKMHWVGLFLLAMGLIVIATGVVNSGHLVFHLAPILSGSLTCLVGLWTQRASVSLKNVVYTEGRDISHLIAALEDLRRLYSLQFWLFILGLVMSTTILWLLAMGYFVEVIE
jgi:hypothetical protein